MIFSLFLLDKKSRNGNIEKDFYGIKIFSLSWIDNKSEMDPGRFVLEQYHLPSTTDMCAFPLTEAIPKKEWHQRNDAETMIPKEIHQRSEARGMKFKE